MSAVLAAPSLLARFETAITFLCQSVAANFLKTPAAPLVPLAWNRLRRLLARFAALVACIEAGRNLARRAPAAAGARSRPDLPSLRLPADRGWLLRLAPALDTRLGRGWVEALVSDPDFALLLEAAPRAGRILRPLCHALAIELPPPLRLPARPRKQRRPDRSGGTAAHGQGDLPSQPNAARPGFLPWLPPPAFPVSAAASPPPSRPASVSSSRLRTGPRPRDPCPRS